MPEKQEEIPEVGGSECCLDISLQPLASQLKASDGRNILFTRAILAISNVCGQEVGNIRPHAALGQEGGTVQDVSGSLVHAVRPSIPPGETVRSDVYDLLLPAHSGTASKMHMFGYRAVLNWRFDLSVWLEYRISKSDAPVRTPVARWAFHWSTANAYTGEIGLTIDEIVA